jgi:hypothetical protein
MHVDLSVSMRGWAHSIGYRTYHIFDLPPHHLLHHHQPSPFRCPQGSKITLLTNDDDPLGGSLASPGAQGDHRLSKAQAEGQTSLQRQNKVGAKVEGSPFCHGNYLLQGWLLRRVAPALHLQRSPPSDCPPELQWGPRPSPLRLQLLSYMRQQPCILLHGQLPSPLQNPTRPLRRGQGGWNQ